MWVAILLTGRSTLRKVLTMGIVKMRDCKPREMKSPVRDLSVTKWQSWALDPGGTPSGGSA